jgi:hypothetical protein
MKQISLLQNFQKTQCYRKFRKCDITEHTGRVDSNVALYSGDHIFKSQFSDKLSSRMYFVAYAESTQEPQDCYCVLWHDGFLPQAL